MPSARSPARGFFEIWTAPSSSLKTGFQYDPVLSMTACVIASFSLKAGANHGFTNCALDDSIWVWEGSAEDSTYTVRKPVQDRQAAGRPPPVAGRPLPVRELLHVGTRFSNGT